MTNEEALRYALRTVRADANFTEAVMTLDDESRLCFCHRVGQRWAKAVGPTGREEEPGLAGEFLVAIAMFRLNAKHLDIQFQDGTRWEESLESNQ